MTTQYTSGPWFVDRSHPDWVEGTTIWANDVVIAHAVADQHHQTEANARLIAAAPELFAALEQAYYSLKLAAVRLELDESTEFYKDIDAAYRALQKAKGEPA
jgi:hypothetical protein